MLQLSMSNGGPKSGRKDRPGWDIVPGKPELSADEIDNTLTIPPKHLPPLAKEHFIVLIDRVRQAKKPEDLIMITRAAELHGIMQEAYQSMTECGVVVDTPRHDGKKNPASQIFNQSLTLYLKILKILGIESVGKRSPLKKLTGMKALLSGSEDDDGDGEDD